MLANQGRGGDSHTKFIHNDWGVLCAENKRWGDFGAFYNAKRAIPVAERGTRFDIAGFGFNRDRRETKRQSRLDEQSQTSGENARKHVDAIILSRMHRGLVCEYIGLKPFWRFMARRVRLPVAQRLRR